MTMTNIVKNDIKDLRGKEVRIFGQKTVLSDTVNDYTIDILDVLDSLSEYEICLNDYTDYRYDEESEEETEVNIFENVENSDTNAIFETLEEYGYIKDVCDYKGDNSYNWSSPVSNDFDIKIYKDTMSGGMFVEFKVHRFGDVRGNYTDSIIYHFDNDYTFYEILTENNKYNFVTVNNEEYEVEVNILSDSFEVYQDGTYICTTYGCDKEEIIENIIEKIA